MRGPNQFISVRQVELDRFLASVKFDLSNARIYGE
jgi:hypothetical protein